MKAMKMIITTFLLAACSANSSKIDEAGWLLGTWVLETKRGAVLESWIKKSETEYAGVSYTIADGDTVILETIRIIEEDEELFYIPTVSDQNEAKPVRFTASFFSSTEMTFENAAHDFPQVISYKQVTADSIIAVISGMVDSQEKRRQFPMNRLDEE